MSSDTKYSRMDQVKFVEDSLTITGNFFLGWGGRGVGVGGLTNIHDSQDGRGRGRLSL